MLIRPTQLLCYKFNKSWDKGLWTRKHANRNWRFITRI